jgi:2-polyprenyl-6-methoxyphenol hydroxylase-like FAD-dependent oxidoreductase
VSPDHVVVIGGSIAGLLATRVYSEHAARVTIVERDELPDHPANRKGVPQARQAHGALPFGVAITESLFPGFREEMEEKGAPVIDAVRDIAWWSGVGWRARGETDVRPICFTRPLWEYVLRTRTLALPNVELRQGSVEGFLTHGKERVSGVRLGDGEQIEADFVHDASGRGSRSSKWIEELGFEPPIELQVLPHMGYTSQLVSVPDGAFPGDMRSICSYPIPGFNRGAGILPQEDGLHVVYGVGMVRDYPPTEPDAFLDFIAGAPSPAVREVALQCEPVNELRSYHMPGNYWRRWDQLRARPRGFALSGDAIAAFNPIYGQGMAIAAFGAQSLNEVLAEDADFDSVPERLSARLNVGIEWAFGSASAVDGGFEGTEYHGVEPFEMEQAEYLMRLEEVATVDTAVGAVLHRSFGYMEPELLFDGEMTTKVDEWVAAGEKPRNTDPSAPPPSLTVSA